MNASFTILICVPLFLLVACAGERPANLGVKDGRLTACPTSPNCISSTATDEQHRVLPFATGTDPDATFKRLMEIVKNRPDATVIEITDTYLKVELRTTLFVDDAEFFLDRGDLTIEIRSASRIGYSDLGLNRRRIEEIRDQLNSR